MSQQLIAKLRLLESLERVCEEIYYMGIVSKGLKDEWVQ